MSEIIANKKTQKSKQYLKITMSETTDFEKMQNSKQYLKITWSKTSDLERSLKIKMGSEDFAGIVWIFVFFCLQ